MGSEIDDLMARFENLNAGPYAIQPVERERERNIQEHLPPDELQDRLNQLRNPEKMERDLEEYEAKQREYMEQYDDDYDFGEIPLKREELPLDTDVYSQAIKKIQNP